MNASAWMLRRFHQFSLTFCHCAYHTLQRSNSTYIYRCSVSGSSFLIRVLLFTQRDYACIKRVWHILFSYKLKYSASATDNPNSNQLILLMHMIILAISRHSNFECILGPCRIWYGFFFPFHSISSSLLLFSYRCHCDALLLDLTAKYMTLFTCSVSVTVLN